MKKALTFLFAVVISFAAEAQTQFTVGFDMWPRSAHHNLEQTSDGGYILMSEVIPVMDTAVVPVGRVFLLKLNAVGTLQWAKSFPKSDGVYKVSGEENSLTQTADGGYILATTYHIASTLQAPGRRYAYLVKTDALGNVVWSGLYPGRGNSASYCVRQTADYGYIVCGGTSDSTGNQLLSDGFLFRTDSVGTLQWSRVYDPLTSTIPGTFYTVCETSSGGFVASGDGAGAGVIIQTDAAGVIVWSNQFAGVRIMYDVMEIPGGGFIAVGANHQQNNTAVYEVNSAGNGVWAKQYQFGNEFLGYDLVRNTTGYTIAGIRNSWSNTALAHIDFAGNPVWAREYPEANGWLSPALFATSDGGYVFTARHDGNSANDQSVIVVKTDSTGAALCDSVITGNASILAGPGPTGFNESSVPLTKPITTIMTPAMLVEYVPCQPTPLGTGDDHDRVPVRVYPNPADDRVNIEFSDLSGQCLRIRLYDALGQVVRDSETERQYGSVNYVMDLTGLASGLYVLKVEADGVPVITRSVIRTPD